MPAKRSSAYTNLMSAPSIRLPDISAVRRVMCPLCGCDPARLIRKIELCAWKPLGDTLCEGKKSGFVCPLSHMFFRCEDEALQLDPPADA